MGLLALPFAYSLAAPEAAASRITPRDDDVLVVVDVQNSFVPGGALAVKEGDRIVPLVNRIA
ncbi:MAG TPA: hypothetical protein VNH12_08865, partial [Burkholderiales bacterium]|nr:hypothetical protein [Burkholderiales bacterium]